MTAKERTQAAARVITEHRAVYHNCRCGQEWTPLHVAQELDKAGLLCALVEDAS